MVMRIREGNPSHKSPTSRTLDGGKTGRRQGSSRFLKKAAQKFLLCWVMGCVADNAHDPN
ncbi:hypothetical protein [Acidocella sp.]|jgi:hypothetical protein|uniref:hypothetical protein n=1 Tax=Acidocella sp. TaxID=50710 RepID=UPI002F42314C